MHNLARMESDDVQSLIREEWKNPSVALCIRFLLIFRQQSRTDHFLRAIRSRYLISGTW